MDRVPQGVRERGFLNAVLKLAYERHFGTPFSHIPEGTAILFRGEHDTRFRLLTKISDQYDAWIGDDHTNAGTLMDWTQRSVAVYQFGPGENGAIKIFDAKVPFAEIICDLEIDKFILDIENNMETDVI